MSGQATYVPRAACRVVVLTDTGFTWSYWVRDGDAGVECARVLLGVDSPRGVIIRAAVEVREGGRWAAMS